MTKKDHLHGDEMTNSDAVVRFCKDVFAGGYKPGADDLHHAYVANTERIHRQMVFDPHKDQHGRSAMHHCVYQLLLTEAAWQAAGKQNNWTKWRMEWQICLSHIAEGWSLDAALTYLYT